MIAEKTSRKLRVELAFGLHKVGDVIEPNGLRYQQLLGMCWNGQKYVSPVKDEVPETPKRRGRPPKE